MKKKIIILLFALFTLTGCFGKDLTLQAFKNTMEKNGYSVIDSSDDIITYYDKTKDIVFMYFNIKNQKDFNRIMSSDKEDKFFEMSKSGFFNKIKYTFSNKDERHIYLRFSNSCVVALYNVKNEKECEKIFEELGY